MGVLHWLSSTRGFCLTE